MSRLRIFLCGDVMLGRGIDQALPCPCDPRLHEDYASSALDYLRLAERANGKIKIPFELAQVWGDALDEFDHQKPDLRIVNLETSVTRSEDWAPKGINYRTSPENAGCLRAAGIDCCVLANNHVLDWGRAGLLDTLTSLRQLGIKTAGAGGNIAEAAAPAILDAPSGGRVLVFSFALATSGVPRHWAATQERAGVNLLSDLSDARVGRIAEDIMRVRQPNDIIIASLHWGANWGYDIAQNQRQFAGALIERADVSIVHGHSSHHAKAIEIHRGRPILYGCGDFLNDYEGILGYEEYRDDLALMYFIDLDTQGRDLVGLTIVPLQIRRLQLNRPCPADIEWARATLTRESAQFGVSFTTTSERGFGLSRADTHPSPS